MNLLTQTLKKTPITSACIKYNAKTAIFSQSYVYHIVKEKNLNYKKGWEIFG